MTMRLKEFARATRDRMNRLDDSNWDQGCGTYHRLFPKCCVGAHLARHFKVTEALGEDYIRGYWAAAHAVGCNIVQLEMMLQAAGAPYRPFTSGGWRRHPSLVWRNLEKIEEAPPFNSSTPQHMRNEWVITQRKKLGITGDPEL